MLENSFHLTWHTVGQHWWISNECQGRELCSEVNYKTTPGPSRNMWCLCLAHGGTAAVNGLSISSPCSSDSGENTMQNTKYNFNNRMCNSMNLGECLKKLSKHFPQAFSNDSVSSYYLSNSHVSSSNSKCLETLGQLYDTIFVLQDTLI